MADMADVSGDHMRGQQTNTELLKNAIAAALVIAGVYALACSAVALGRLF
jgi:hypothetical protein